MVVRDAFGAQTPARPATSRILASRLLAVLLSFVLLQLCKAVFGPISNLRAGDFLRNWLWDRSLLNPSMQSGAMNSKQPRGFRNRVLCHLEYATRCRALSSVICGSTADHKSTGL